MRPRHELKWCGAVCLGVWFLIGGSFAVAQERLPVALVWSDAAVAGGVRPRAVGDCRGVA